MLIDEILSDPYAILCVAVIFVAIVANLTVAAFALYGMVKRRIARLDREIEEHRAAARARALVRGPAPPPSTIEHRNAVSLAEYQRKRLERQLAANAARVGE